VGISTRTLLVDLFFSKIVKYFCIRVICESLNVKDHRNKLIRVLGAGHGLFQFAQPGAE
jgi:hypothetical protein